MASMTSTDAGRIVDLMRAEQLAVSVAHYRGENQLVTDYMDMAKKLRLQETHMKNLYSSMAENGGVDFELMTEHADVAHLAGFQRLVWTKLEGR